MSGNAPAVSRSASAGVVPVAAWWALAVSGLAFWFLVGFPFGHHNESYVWIERLSTHDVSRVAWHHFYGAAGYRPLAMLLAWAMFQVGDGSLVPIQLLNFLVTILAWWSLSQAAVYRRTFALAALVGGGLLFSGYIYLFHLHGVFYGPMLLWLAWAVRASEGELTPRQLGILFVTAIVVALVHTYTLVLCLALIGGTMVERGWLRRPGVLAFALGSCLAGAVLIAVSAPQGLLTAPMRGMIGLATSLRAVEVNRIVSVASVLLALVTVASTRWPSHAVKLIALATTLISALVLSLNEVPLLFVWLVAGGVKACLHRRWALALMLLASLGLPFVGGSGSPTYVVFALALLIFLVAVDADGIEQRLRGLKPGHALAASGLLVFLALVVRSGVNVPVITRLARPVLAEKERTHQGERILREILASPWRAHPVRLASDALVPIATGGAVDRRQRAPTQQVCIDDYLEYKRGRADSTAAPIILSFGVVAGEGREPRWVVRGRYAGDAVAVLADTTRGNAPDSAVRAR